MSETALEKVTRPFDYFNGALCSFKLKTQSHNSEIHIINEVIIQTQKYFFQFP